MPMAGRGSRFAGMGAKPYIELNGKPFFYWATQSALKSFDVESLDFVVLSEHNSEDEIHKYYPNAAVHELSDVTEGAVITCLNGCSNIDDDIPVMFNDCDHMFKCSDYEEILSSDADGVLMTFTSKEPKYSFVEKDENGNVIRTAEKEVISDEAICGCYYFKNVDIFRNAAEEYLKTCHYSEFFMSGVYNVLIENGYKVKTVLTDFHVPFGVPEEYEKAKESKYFKELI